MKNRLLPKGIVLHLLCEAIDSNRNIVGFGKTEEEAIERMKASYNDEYTIRWAAYCLDKNGYFLNAVFGNTEDDALYESWKQELICSTYKIKDENKREAYMVKSHTTNRWFFTMHTPKFIKEWKHKHYDVIKL